MKAMTRWAGAVGVWAAIVGKPARGQGTGAPTFDVGRWAAWEQPESLPAAAILTILGDLIEGDAPPVFASEGLTGDRLWSALSDGGSEGRCGWLKDRWGMSWQIVPRRLHELLADANPDRARRAMEAMLQMSKLNIAELDRAADGR
jgi:hypothetical protein